MTRLGGAVLLFAIFGLGAALRTGQAAAALTSLTMLLWIFQSWMYFLFLHHWRMPLLTISRTINGQSAHRRIVQADRTLNIEIQLTLPRHTSVSTLNLMDVSSEHLQINSGSNAVQIRGSLTRGVIRYQGVFRGSGTAIFPGVRFTLADSCGFFRSDWFVPEQQEVLILPAWASAGDFCPQTKRMNMLPRHGIHTFRRSGAGSELLELREYQPGDAPRSIAWKVSARRDQLMSRQYEAEVPMRVQFIVDGTISMRLGGFGSRLLDQALFVASSVARSAVSIGDEVGAICCDERGLRQLLPRGGDRGFRELQKFFAEFSDNPAPPPDLFSPSQQTLALTLLDLRYPQLLNHRLNSIPWTLFPLLPWSREQFRTRLLLAGALAEYFQLSIRKHIQLVADDRGLARITQAFLARERMAWLTPVVSLRDRGTQDGLHRMKLIADSLTRLTARARDNEVFVILADLQEVAHNFSHMLPSIRLARSRHHKVIAVSPASTFQRPGREPLMPRTTSAEDLLLTAEQIRVTELQDDLQLELRKAGVPASCSGEQHAIRLIASELQLTRSGRVAATGGTR